MLDLLRAELAQEVPAAQEALIQWQASPLTPPDGLVDLVMLLERFAQAVTTVGLDGLATYLLLLKGTVVDLAQQSSAQDSSTEGEPITYDIDTELVWLMQSFDTVDTYLLDPSDAGMVEAIAAFLRSSPYQFAPDIILSIASQLLATSSTDAQQESEFDELSPAQAQDVTLATAEVDTDLLAALLADAPAQLELLEAAITRWGAGVCTEAEMIEAQRGAHTFKGSGYIIGLPGIGHLAHRLEDVLDYALQGIRQGVPPSAALLQDVLQAVYCLQQMIGYLQQSEPEPDNAQAVLQRLLDWVAAIRAGDTARMEAEAPVGAVASAIATVQVQASARGADATALRVEVTQLARLLRRAGQSIIHTERVARLLLDADQWLLAMERNNQVLGGRLRELELMVNSQVTQLRQAQTEGDQFDPLELDRYDALHGLTRFIGEAARDSSELVQQIRRSTSQSGAILRDEGYALVEQHRELLSARMVSVKTLVPRLKRTVAQTAHATGRSVLLQIRGEEVAVDADVLNRLAEPLLHLLRNAVDHGIETPAHRLAAGKAEQGLVQLTFTRVGEEVVLSVRDDGCGLDWQAIQTKAQQYGLVKADASLSQIELQRLILQPGFSTRDAVTATSGRGVGLDIVNDRIIGLKGRLDIDSQLGMGCCFTVRVPVTSGVAHALLVQCVGDVVALPLEQVHSILAAGLAQFEQDGESIRLAYEDRHYPAHVLSQWLALEDYRAEEVMARAANWIVVLAHGAHGPVALLVDAVLESRELILQDIGQLMRRVRGVIGGALRSDGRPLFLIGVAELELAAKTSTGLRSSRVLRRRLEVQRTTVLVVDDAWSVRRSMQQLLEDAGYEVQTAADGYEALERLRAKLPAMVITDLEMPNLNGLELTSRIREVPLWQHLPVLMITSRTSEKHRNHAQQIGVNAYLTKPYQDAELLSYVRECCDASAQTSRNP